MTDVEGRPIGRGKVLLGGALAAVLLAAVGGTAGWLLAGPDAQPTAAPTAAVTPTSAPEESADPVETSAPAPERSTAAPAASPPGTPAASTGGLTVPPLVGTDFEEARDELHDRKLGWRLVFGGGTGRDVVRTQPAAGSPVRRGTTVQVYVSGPAPEVTVPDLVGKSCADAAEELGEKGLYPRYRTGRTGRVSVLEPAAGSPAHWNDAVALSCGAAGSPAPTPTASPET